MLSILPYGDRSQQQRDVDRPFKSYSRPTLSSSHSAHNSYYNPFAHSGFISSLHSNPTTEPSKHDAPMDLRPHSSMYDARTQYDNPPYMDMSSQFQNRIPNIKSEHSIPGHPLYPPINMNPAHAHSNGYSSAMDMPNMREMSPPTQPTMPNMGPSLNTSPPGSANHPDMRTMPSLSHHQPDVFPQNEHSPPQEDRTQNGSSNTNAPARHSPGNSVASPSGSSNNDEETKPPPKKRPYVVPEDMKDQTYWDKRKKNNDSAKRSREARRMKEEQIAMRVVYLEQDNLQLRTEVSLLKSEIEKLRCMLYNS